MTFHRNSTQTESFPIHNNRFEHFLPILLCSEYFPFADYVIPSSPSPCNGLSPSRITMIDTTPAQPEPLSVCLNLPSSHCLTSKAFFNAGAIRISYVPGVSSIYGRVRQLCRPVDILNITHVSILPSNWLRSSAIGT